MAQHPCTNALADCSHYRVTLPLGAALVQGGWAIYSSRLGVWVIRREWTVMGWTPRNGIYVPE